MYSDEIRENEKENKKQEFELHPFTKWKRILLFLADYFLTFIISFAVLNIAIVPLIGAISQADTRGENIRQEEYNRQNVLYGNKLLFYENNDDKYNYSSSLKHTYDRWISYYVLNDMIGVYGPNIENEVLIHYYKDIRNDEVTYINVFKTKNEKNAYFLYDEVNHSFSLKAEIKDELKLHYIYPDESLSENGKKYLDSIADMFTSLLKSAFEDINEKDLTFNEISYLTSVKNLKNLTDEDHLMMSLSLIISYILSWLIYYMVIPLINSNGKTLAMMIMKAERVDYKHLSLLKRGDVALTSVYHLFTNMSFMFLLPLTYSSSGFIYVLSLPIIPLLFVLSFLLGFVSLILILVNSFNRALTDLTSRSVIVSKDDLDAIYRYKGYYVK